MSAGGGGGFFNRLNPWGAGGGGAPGGHQGGGLGGRGGSHPRPHHGPGGGWRGISFEDSTEYDFADNDRNLYGEGQYPPHRAFSDAEYEARRNAIFNPEGAPPTNTDSRESMPPPETTWYEQQGGGLYPPPINMPGSLGQQGQSITHGPPGGRQMGMPSMLRGPQGHPPATGPPGGGHITRPPAAPLPAPTAQQGGAQIAVHPTGNMGGGVPQAVTGRGTQAITPHEYSGINMALERLAPIITDADTSRNLHWQHDMVLNRGDIAFQRTANGLGESRSSCSR
jgi:hypothetical protein